MIGNDRRGLVVQERDLRLLGALATLRVIDCEQAKCVAGFGSTTRANVRLLALTRAGLLRRFFLGTTAGGKKALYALSPAGAKLVNVAYRGPRRSQDEILVADAFVAHQLRVNSLYCAVKHGTIPVPGARFIRWMSFWEALENGNRLIPDGYFEISTAKQTIAAFLEVDLGHEGHAIWKAKIDEYLRYALSGNFAERFDQQQFRVLVVTNSDRRRDALRATVASKTQKIFWFSTFDSIEKEGMWSPVWLRPKDGEQQSLISLP
jgi:hypothetical protein